MEQARLILKSGKDQSLRRFHPWVFSGAIKKTEGEPAEGAVVGVYSNKDKFLGLGHYQNSSIAVRIISFEQIDPDDAFWRNKIESAYALRQRLSLTNNTETNAYRLVYAEGDGMPGLIIDYYNGTAIFQAHSAGMYLIRNQIVDALKSIYGSQLQAVYDKSAATLPFNSPVKGQDGYLYGQNTSREVMENGMAFKVDWEKGQKTGFYLDQRDNRTLLGKYAKGQKVLNMFCYTGGFSVYALKNGASLVHSVDSSKEAVNMLDENVALNNLAEHHKGYAKDAFDFMKEMEIDYDIVVLDPPAFAKHRNVLSNALQGYKKLNAAAISRIKKGGLIFTFSCSQVVSLEEFKKTVFTAANNCNRKVQILHQLTQPADHPISVYHPEGAYLKGLVVRVE
jgi:23S rRNA (cytosine1962-C5)-methyltransferase